MRRHFGIMAIVGLLAAGNAGWAQVRPLPPPPDLSGSWRIASTDGLSDSPLGDRFAVKQDASTITFTTGGEVLTYRLDDSANVRMTQTVTGETWRRVSRARFVTAALLVTTRIDAGPTGHLGGPFHRVARPAWGGHSGHLQRDQVHATGHGHAGVQIHQDRVAFRPLGRLSLSGLTYSLQPTPAKTAGAAEPGIVGRFH
jgi:hypothetical protein